MRIAIYLLLFGLISAEAPASQDIDYASIDSLLHQNIKQVFKAPKKVIIASKELLKLDLTPKQKTEAHRSIAIGYTMMKANGDSILPHVQAAIDLFDQFEDDFVKTSVMVCLTGTHLYRRDTISARKAFVQTQKYLSDSVYTKRAADIMRIHALLYVQRGTQMEHDIFRKSLKVYRQRNDSAGITQCYSGMAAFVGKTDMAAAETLLDSAYSYIDTANDVRGLLSFFKIKARILKSVEKYGEAIDAYKNFLRIANQVEYYSRVVEVELIISKLYAKQGDFESSLTALQRSYDARRKFSENPPTKLDLSAQNAYLKHGIEILSIAQESQQEVVEEEKRNNYLLTLLIGAISVLLVVVLFLAWRLHLVNQKLKSKNQGISELNTNLEKLVSNRTTQLEKRNQQIIDFSIKLSHEIRMPLTNVLGLLTLLEDPASRTDKNFELLISQAEKMDEIVKSASNDLSEIDHEKSINSTDN